MELRRLGREDFRFYAGKDLEMCMDMIEDIRRQFIYPYPESDCRTECKLRGVKTVFLPVCSVLPNGTSAYLHICE